MSNHPRTGHLIVGEVVLWSPYTQNIATTKLKDDETATMQGQQNSAQPNAKLRSTTHSRVDFESNETF